MLAIDPRAEVTYPLSDLAKQLSSMLGRKISRWQVIWWATEGCRKPGSKKRVYLETIRGPGCMESSVEAYFRLIEKLNQ